MTLRALLVGLTGALFIAGFGYINNNIISLEPIESGHLLPVGVIGLMLLVLLAINPLLFLFRRRWAFRPAECAVVVSMMLVACSIPGRGLMEQFTTSLVMPMHWNKVNPSWRHNDLMGYVPPALLAADKQDDPEVVEAFIMGKGTPDRRIGLAEVPWEAWRKPLAFWLGLVALTGAAVLSLVLLVHRQWAEHEQLPFPIASFVATMVGREEGRAFGGVFRQRAFWLGFGFVFALRVWNGLYVWFPENLAAVPVRFNFSPLASCWPGLTRAPWGGSLFWPTVYPLVIGFSFFLATDVSFTLGISQFLFVPIAAALVSYGVEMQSSYMAGGPMGWHRSGAYLALAVMIAYIGRRYYTQAFKRAFLGHSEDPIEAHVAWACRILVAALILMTGLLISQGLDWTLAIGTVGLIVVMFLGVSRLSAETGMFLIHPRWQPLGVFLGLFGPYALGPEALVIIGLVCVVISLDPSQSLVAYFTNALRLSSRLKVPAARSGIVAGLTYAGCVALAVVVVLWAQYNYGCPKYNWTFERVPTMTFRPADDAVSNLVARGTLEESENLAPLQRLSRIQPETTYLWAAGTGFFLVLLVSSLRLRIPRWPLHPVLFLVWASYPMATLHHSFLLGWIIKVMVTKYGGQRAYHTCKPTMAGLIAGDLGGVFVFMIVGAIYYLVTGDPPLPYRVYPR